MCASGLLRLYFNDFNKGFEMIKYAKGSGFAVYRSPDALIKSAHRTRQHLVTQRLASFDPVRLDPAKFLYLRNRSISCEELWGPNFNADSFPAGELIKAYASFVGKPIDIDHTPSLVIGSVVDGLYVPPMILKGSAVAAAVDGNIPMEPFHNFGSIEVGDQVVGGWIENAWAIDKAALDGFYPHATEAVQDGVITDTSMGCFLPGTPITLADGTRKPIEDIVVGDKVLTHLGNTESVTHTMCRAYKGLVYDVRVYGQASPLIATPEHPVWVRHTPPSNGKARRRGLSRPTSCICGASFDNHQSLSAHVRESVRWGWDSKHAKVEDVFKQWTDVKDIKIGDWVCTPAMNVGGMDVGDYHLARLLGYYLAEGNVGCDRKRYGDIPQWVEWHFNVKEESYVQEVKSSIHALGFKASGPYIKSNCASVRCFSPKLAGRLMDLGGKYSWAKQLSSEAMGWSEENALALINAYWNGDGCYKGGNVMSGTASKDLADQLHTLAVRCRITISPPIKSYSPSIVSAGDRPRYILQCNFKPAEGDFKQYAGCDQMRVDDQGVWRRVTDVLIRSYDGVVYNFDVGGDSSYVASDVGVHNCEVEKTQCNICGNNAESVDEFCEHIGFWGVNKGSLWADNRFGMQVPSYERCFGMTFFEDSLILPESFNYQPGSQGADPNAKVLQILANRNFKGGQKEAQALADGLTKIYKMLPASKQEAFLTLLTSIGS
jgi:hypothetical protein